MKIYALNKKPYTIVDLVNLTEDIPLVDKNDRYEDLLKSVYVMVEKKDKEGNVIIENGNPVMVIDVDEEGNNKTEMIVVGKTEKFGVVEYEVDKEMLFADKLPVEIVDVRTYNEKNGSIETSFAITLHEIEKRKQCYLKGECFKKAKEIEIKLENLKLKEENECLKSDILKEKEARATHWKVLCSEGKKSIELENRIKTLEEAGA